MKDFVIRNTPRLADAFLFETCADDQGCDHYEIDSRDQKIVIAGNNKVAMAMGYYHYLRTCCGVLITNGRYDISYVKSAPLPAEKISCTVRQKIRMAMTPERFAAEADAWGTDRWEKEIDFMAMHGVNTPLMLVGSDAVLYKMLEDMRVPQNTALEFISGGAFWYQQLRGRIFGYMPLNDPAYFEKKITIGRWVTAREQSLDMSPIHQGALLTVPFSFRRHYPRSKLVRLPVWNAFPPAMTIDANDRGYAELFQKLYLQKQRELMGEVRNYLFDPLCEDVKGYRSFAEKTGETFYDVLKETDPDAVWFVHAAAPLYFQKPQPDVVVIDEDGTAYAEKNGFGGTDFVVGLRGSEHGRTVVGGDMETLAQNPYLHARETQNNAVGTGLFFDSDYENPMHYALAAAMLTSDRPADLRVFLSDYAKCCYGTDAHTDVLMKLQALCYGKNSTRAQASGLCARPSGELQHTAPLDTFERPYENGALLTLIKQALEDDTKKNDRFRADFQKLLRQVMSNALRPLYFQVYDAFHKQDAAAFEQVTNLFIELGEAIDRLLKTQEETNLFYHLEQARQLGETKELRQNLELNYLMYHTIYGPLKHSVYYDNEWREWGGMAKDFYLQRWYLCFRMMASYFKTPRKFKDVSRHKYYERSAFAKTLLAQRIEYKENAWLKDYIPRHTGICEEETLAVMREIIEKFEPILLSS